MHTCRPLSQYGLKLLPLLVIKILLYRLPPLHPPHHFPWASLLVYPRDNWVISLPVEQDIVKGQRTPLKPERHLGACASMIYCCGLVCLYADCLPNFHCLLLLLVFVAYSACNWKWNKQTNKKKQQRKTTHAPLLFLIFLIILETVWFY